MNKNSIRTKNFTKLIDKRFRDLESGKVKGIPEEEVLKNLKSIFHTSQLPKKKHTRH